MDDKLLERVNSWAEQYGILKEGTLVVLVFQGELIRYAFWI